ncbi:histidine phosphatase family protein [Caldanaerobius polysaccharolyticus]|uniref:histidine phosphatase family protein n=1 Tax=Caldanaerobius polysaccharolyticus TaxID=44256 RepID=UPI00047BDFAB|nr:histidine phosphatase family protein [Caldanaerobius polysaccharolyticus]
MRVYLIRHGETDANQKGIYAGWSEAELTPKGMEQTDRIVDFLKEVGIDGVYASPSKRCMHVAMAFMGTVPVKALEELREQNFGVFEGLMWHQAKRQYPMEWERWCRDPEYRIPGGESFSEFYSRVIKGFEGIVAGGAQSVAVITHGGPIKAILSYIVCGDQGAFWRFKVDNGSVSMINIAGDGYAVIEKVNCTFAVGKWL